MQVLVFEKDSCYTRLIGPTNSGKTYSALERLKKCTKGLYCAPLRLLAMEVFDTLNRDGVYCNLVTGKESVDPVSTDGIRSGTERGTWCTAHFLNSRNGQSQSTLRCSSDR